MGVSHNSLVILYGHPFMILKRIHRDTEKKPCEIEEEIEVILSQTKDSLEPPRGERGKEVFSPRAFRGTIALLIP